MYRISRACFTFRSTLPLEITLMYREATQADVTTLTGRADTASAARGERTTAE